MAGDSENVMLEITDRASCRAACDGIDTVVHLAADANPDADFDSSLLPNNIVGTFNVFQAAIDSGCKRVIFASSAQAVEGYPLDHQVRESDPVRPRNLYGVSKAFGEALGYYFSAAEGLSCIAVRIANFAAFHKGEAHSARDMSAYLSEPDAKELLIRCIEVEATGFAVVNGVSDNRFKRLDLTFTKKLLGYAPSDDAFKILGIELFDSSREPVNKRMARQL
jgi:thioester reductase-like protein